MKSTDSTSPASSTFAPFIEAAVVAAPVAALSLAVAPAGAGGAMVAIRSGGEAMLAHYIATMIVGSDYGKASNGYFNTAAGMEVEVASLTGGLLGAWVYFSSESANLALKSALLAGAASWVGSMFVLKQYNKMTTDKSA
jgi:hypothetical protein